MFTLLGNGLALWLARWRWLRGRCPRCNRNLVAAFPYTMTAFPNCTVCRGETTNDLRVWHAYRALAPQMLLVKQRD